MPERATVMNRSESSAEAIVAAYTGRRAKREGKLEDMLLECAMHQMPGQLGRANGGKGEARLAAVSDEARLAYHKQESLGRGAIPLDCDLTFSNRPVRTRMPGGVGGVRLLGVPYPDQSACISQSFRGSINNKQEP